MLGDADMKSSSTIIPLFKRERGGQATVGPKVNLFPLVFLLTHLMPGLFQPKMCGSSGDS